MWTFFLSTLCVCHLHKLLASFINHFAFKPEKEKIYVNKSIIHWIHVCQAIFFSLSCKGADIPWPVLALRRNWVISTCLSHIVLPLGGLHFAFPVCTTELGPYHHWNQWKLFSLTFTGCVGHWMWRTSLCEELCICVCEWACVCMCVTH